MKTVPITFNPPNHAPDADQDVLASILREDGSIEVWEAHCVDGVWWTSNGTWITRPVVSWADKPAGVDLRNGTACNQIMASQAETKLREALQALLASGGEIAEATDDELQAAIDDPDAEEIVKVQAAAVLNARQALTATEQAAPSVPQGEPVAWQARFLGQEWAPCTKEHHDWVRREPKEFVGYEVRALCLCATPAAPSQPAVPQGLPEHETKEMHDAVMAVLYNGVGRTETDKLWQAYRAALLASTPAAPSQPAVPEIDYPELIRAAYATDKKWAQGTNGCSAFARGAEWFRDQVIAALREKQGGV